VATANGGIILWEHKYIVGFGILFHVPERYTAAMSDAAQTLPDDPSQLKDMVTALSGECGALMGELKSRDILIEKLKHQLAGMRQHRFGSRSEALDQLALTLEDEEIAASAQESSPDDADQPAPPPKGKPKRKPLPDHLSRNETTLSPGVSCGECGGNLKTLGEDVTEELEYIPGRFVVNRIIRPRMTCTCCETFHQAALPSRPIERGRPGPGLLAPVLVNKYADHSPLYRQSQIFQREGINLDRSTLSTPRCIAFICNNQQRKKRTADWRREEGPEI